MLSNAIISHKKLSIYQTHNVNILLAHTHTCDVEWFERNSFSSDMNCSNIVGVDNMIDPFQLTNRKKKAQAANHHCYIIREEFKDEIEWAEHETIESYYWNFRMLLISCEFESLAKRKMVKTNDDWNH